MIDDSEPAPQDGDSDCRVNEKADKINSTKVRPRPMNRSPGCVAETNVEKVDDARPNKLLGDIQQPV